MASDNAQAPTDPHSVLLVVVDGQVVASAINIHTASIAIDEVLRTEVEDLIQLAGTVEETVDLLELGGYRVEIETRTYPREDTCYKCGAHVGWVVSFVGELFALGVCDGCADDDIINSIDHRGEGDDGD